MVAASNTSSLLKGGVITGALFFAITIIEILARPGFDIERHAISMLSLGPRGWVMKACFIASGCLCSAAHSACAAPRGGSRVQH